MVKKRNIVFILMFFLYIVFLLLCLPTYLQSKMLGFHNELLFNLWKKIYLFIRHNSITDTFYCKLRHKIPEWTMPVAVIVNGINMFFGFREYKKKWWYYIILLISILISVMLIDCWHILYTMP